MRTLRRSPLPALASIALAACSSAREPTYFPENDSGASVETAPACDAIDDGGADAADAADAANATDAADAREDEASVDARDATAVTDAMDAQPVAATCALPDKLGAPSLLATSSTADDDVLGAITPDERSIAWISIDAAGGAHLHLADRASLAASFAASPTIDAPLGGLQPGKVALSADGLRVLYVTADGRALQQYARPARGAEFVQQAQTAPFDAIARVVADAPTNTISDLVLTADDRTLYFVLREAHGASLRRATRDSAAASWSAGAPILDPALQTDDGPLRPTGASADGLVLFVWDDEARVAYAAMRGGPSEPFAKLRALGARPALQSSADCSTLYYSARTTRVDLDLVAAR